MAPLADGGSETTGVTLDVKLFATLRDAAGRKTVALSYPAPVTLGTVLADLEAECPGLDGVVLADDGDLRSTVSVVLNGRHVSHLDGVDTSLADGDTLALMPPVSGGRGLGRGRAAARGAR